MDVANQLITVLAVLLGSVTSFLATAALERSRHRREMATRWDDRRIDAYLGYIAAVRAQVVAQRTLYETRHGMRAVDRSEPDQVKDVLALVAARGTAFEAVMLLGDSAVIEAAHRLNRAVVAAEWRAMGQVAGTPDEWDALNRDVFQSLNTFHEAARRDLGVNGAFSGDTQLAGGLITPPTT